VLVDQLTPEEDAYFKKFDTGWRSYFNQSPDMYLMLINSGPTWSQPWAITFMLKTNYLAVVRRTLIT